MVSKALLSSDRYERAAAFVPPKFAAQMTGVVGDGYWIDKTRYYYRLGRLVEGKLISSPMIANIATKTVAPAVPLDQLADLIGDYSEARGRIDFADADFDMRDGDTLTVTLDGVAYDVSMSASEIVGTTEVDPARALYSPDGRYACLLVGDALWLRDGQTGVAEKLSPDGEPHYGFGRMLEAGTMSVSMRKASTPVGLWSSNSEWFVTHRSDERHLPTSGLSEHVPPNGGPPIPHVFKIATPGSDLPTIEIAAFHIPSKRMVIASDRKIVAHLVSPFLFKHVWIDGAFVYFFDIDRYFSDVKLVELDLSDGRTRTVISEHGDGEWLELHPSIGNQPLVRVLQESSELIWYSSRTGFGHLYLHDLATGALKNPITSGEWMVREIVHVDPVNRRILFLGSGRNQSDLGMRALYAVGFDGAGLETIDDVDGDVAIRPDIVANVDQTKPARPVYAPTGVSQDGQFAAITIGDAETPTHSLLLDLRTGVRLTVAESDGAEKWKAARPEPFEALAADGVTKLFGVILYPSDFDPNKSYPLVDYIYPGPQMNWFQRRFPNTTVMLLQSVVELGMIGIVVESRGLPFRSNAFHQAGHGRMHEPQLADHAAVVEQLCHRHSFIDRERIGLFGMSGGGYATARALFDYPDVFKVGVSVCGNHDSRNYVSHWLDKYGGRPGSPEHDTQSNTSAAHKLRGKLFLIHGDMDENVRVSHTLALSDALIAAGKTFDQLIVPRAGHGLLIEGAYVVQRLWDFFVRHLLHREPPTDFTLSYEPHEVASAIRLMIAEIS